MKVNGWWLWPLAKSTCWRTTWTSQIALLITCIKLANIFIHFFLNRSMLHSLQNFEVFHFHCIFMRSIFHCKYITPSLELQLITTSHAEKPWNALLYYGTTGRRKNRILFNKVFFLAIFKPLCNFISVRLLNICSYHKSQYTRMRNSNVFRKYTVSLFIITIREHVLKFTNVICTSKLHLIKVTATTEMQIIAT